LEQHEFEQLWRDRDRALEEVFGAMEANVLVGEPSWTWGGGPTVNVYRDRIDRVSFCTSEMTNPIGDEPPILPFELALVVRPESPLAQGAVPAWGGLLRDLGRRIRSFDEIGVGHTIGPLHEWFAPFVRLLLLPMPDHGVLHFGDHSCDLLLAVGIMEDEFQLAKTRSWGELRQRMEQSDVLPFTDPKRQSVCQEAV
jgi:hypothetical protein